MRRLLLDTSVWIEILRNHESPQANRVAGLLHDDNVILSSIVSAELAEGISLSKNPERERAKFSRLSFGFAAESFDFAAADAYGHLRAALRKKGELIGPVDEFIAAHALSLGAVVATLNPKDFKRIPGLRVEDWRA